MIKMIFDFITIPEVAGMLALIALALLLKSKILTELDIARAKKILGDVGNILHDAGALLNKAREATDGTKLTLKDVKPIIEDVKTQVAGTDSARKKIQRTARAILRGWMRL